MILKANQGSSIGSRIKSILIMAMLIGTIITAFQVVGPSSSANASISYSVTVYKSGSTYYAATSAGKIITQGTSASTVINSALKSLTSGGTAYIQAGVYTLSSQLNVLNISNVVITGDSGTILQASVNMGNIFLFSGSSSRHVSGLTLSNLVFDCNLKTAGLNIKWCDKVTISGVEIKNTIKAKYVNGIEIQGSSGSIITGTTVTGCYIHNIYGSGLVLGYSTDAKVISNTFVDCAQVYPSGGAILGNDGCNRITIQNNNISGRTDNDGIYLGTQRSFASGCVVTGNKIIFSGLYNMGGGDYDPRNPSCYAGSGIKIYCISSEVAGNTINWNNAHYGTWPCYTYCIEDWGASYNIHDNILSNAKIGIALFSVSGFPTGSNTLKANQITGCVYGFDISQSGNTITGNTLINCKTLYNNLARCTLTANIMK
jgi:hypothetical protein